jgi:hypothetical protein
VDIQYECTLSDYAEVQKSHFRKSIGYYVVVIGGALCLVAGVLLAALTQIYLAVPLLCLSAFWLGFAFLYLPFKVTRDFQKSPNFARKCFLRADDEGLRSESNVSQGQIKWSAFVRYSETPNLFILFLGPRMFQVIPKRAFLPEQSAEFRELLRRKLPAK